MKKDPRISSLIISLMPTQTFIVIELVRPYHQLFSLLIDLHLVTSTKFDDFLKGEWSSTSFMENNTSTILKPSSITIKALSNMPANCKWWNVSNITDSTSSFLAQHWYIVLFIGICILLIVTIIVTIFLWLPSQTHISITQSMLYSENFEIQELYF